MDDDDLPMISSLEDAAFLASYKEILSNLIGWMSFRPLSFRPVPFRPRTERYIR